MNVREVSERCKFLRDVSLATRNICVGFAAICILIQLQEHYVCSVGVSVCVCLCVSMGPCCLIQINE